MKFVIYATPRSGSTWLANFLSTDDDWVLHDPLGRMSVKQLLFSTKSFIDTGAFLHQDRIQAEGYAEYALARDEEGIKESFRSLGMSADFPRQHNLPLITFRYEDMFNMKYLHNIWNILRPGRLFSEARTKGLMDYHIEHRWDRILVPETNIPAP